jgi:hypothetical protein
MRPLKFFTKNEKLSIVPKFEKIERLKMIMFRFFKPRKFIRFYRYRVALMWRIKIKLERREREIRRNLIQLHVRNRINVPGKNYVWGGSGNSKAKKNLKNLMNKENN